MSRRCRACGAALARSFADLGTTPLSNAFLRADDLARGETYFPLHAFVCDACLLVQLEQFEAPEAIFSDDYAYFSSYSTSWLEHARRYAETMTGKLRLGPGSLVVELASNDGYLLQYFKARGVPVLGVEPAANVARAAAAKGIESLVAFFGVETAERMAAEGRRADLLVGNNVLAHVPDLNDFVGGMGKVLKPDGLITMEFPHLLQLIRHNQFDTIYHEHFSYFSLLAAERVFARHGLAIFDVEELPTHGGSLRIFARHAQGAPPAQAGLLAVREAERAAALDRPETYDRFGERVRECKRRLLGFLIEAKASGKSIVGYGAPAKGNTLLNYCGVRSDFLDYTVDASPHKQGRFLPGTRIPVHAPERIRETRPDLIVVLPWNLLDEITAQMAFVREWGARFVVPIPEPRLF